MPCEQICVRAAYRQNDTCVRFLLLPPGGCKPLKMDAVMCNQHARVRGSKLEMGLVSPSQMTRLSRGHDIEAMNSQESNQQHVDVFIEVYSKRGDAVGHSTLPVAGLNRFPAQSSGIWLASIRRSISGP